MLRGRTAGLDPAMRLDTWDEPDDLSHHLMLLSDLTSLRFAEAGHRVLISGAGVGKTRLATTIEHIGIRRRLSVHASRADKHHFPSLRLTSTILLSGMRVLTSTGARILTTWTMPISSSRPALRPPPPGTAQRCVGPVVTL